MRGMNGSDRLPLCTMRVVDDEDTTCSKVAAGGLKLRYGQYHAIRSEWGIRRVRARPRLSEVTWYCSLGCMALLYTYVFICAY